MLALNHVETLPDGRQVGVFAVGEQHLVLSGLAPLGKWTNELFPPAIGDTVIANTNGFGEGVVLDYVIREGWLGCKVKITKQPEWSIKQSGQMNEFTFFGAELKY